MAKLDSQRILEINKLHQISSQSHCNGTEEEHSTFVEDERGDSREGSRAAGGAGRVAVAHDVAGLFMALLLFSMLTHLSLLQVPSLQNGTATVHWGRLR